MTKGNGIVGYGTYVPYWRLERRKIAELIGGSAARGTRSVASYDEDTTSMGVEAARTALAGTGHEPTAVFFATADPAYQDKTNAVTIAAALSLGDDVMAVDMAGASRSSVGAIHAGLRGAGTSLVVTSDLRTGLPGSGDERDGGDAAAALLLGAGSDDAPLLAEYIGGASTSGEFLDRWRRPGAQRSQVWEERFGEGRYVPLATRAFERALEDAGLTRDQLDHVIVTGLHARAVKSVIRALGLAKEQIVDTYDTSIGNTGAAQAALALGSVLDTAQPRETVAVLSLADGADALLFRTTEAVTAGRQGLPLSEQINAGNDTLTYERFLTWRGNLVQEPPRRPEPSRPAAPPSFQNEEWKFGFIGSVCSCGLAHLPPQRVCASCRKADDMTPRAFATSQATVATYTLDHLAFSMSPPTVAAVLDFDGGGRYLCELTDCDESEVAVGTRVEMTFRRLYTAGDVHNYFWKARPVAVSTTKENAS